MNILSRITNLFQSKTVQDVRSFRDDNTNNGLGAGFSKGLQLADYRPNLQWLYHAKFNNTFQRCNEVIYSQIVKHSWSFGTKKKNTKKQLQTLMQTIGWDIDLIRKIWDEIYGGGGNGVLYFVEGVDGIKLKFTSFYDLATHKTQVRYELDENKIQTFYILDQLGLVIHTRTSDQALHIAKNKNGHLGVSNLMVALPYIELIYNLYEFNNKLVKREFTPLTFISPDYKSIPTTAKDGDATIFETMYNSWGKLVNTVQSSINAGDRKIMSPTPWKVESLMKTNSEMSVVEIIKLAREEVIVACGVSGSVVGYSGTANRAVGEQDRDNLDETTADQYKQYFEEVGNWVLSKFYPDDYLDFEFKFGREETDETIKIREQAITTLQTIPTALANVGYKLDQSSLEILLAKIDPDLKIIENTGNTKPITQNL